MYLMAVGTPYPVGARISVDGKYKEVIGYEFSGPLQLEILLDDGTQVSETIGKTDKIREKYMRKFFESGRSDASALFS